MPFGWEKASLQTLHVMIDSSDGKYRFFCIDIYIDILTKNIDNIDYVSIFFHVIDLT